MLRLIPPPLHRAALRLAYRVRHRLRLVLKVRLRGVSVIVLDGEGRLLLVRHSYGSGAWSLPGGGCRRREQPEAAARREIREEVGLELWDVNMIAAFEETVSGSPHTAFVVTARSRGSLRADRREIIEARYFAPDALPEDMSAFTRQRLATWWGSRELR